MSRRVTISQASKLTGLTEYSLRLGISAGRYPHIRTGGPGKGRILLDIELLEQYLLQDAKDSVRPKATAGALKRIAE
jgi:hypothetical protein